MEIESDEVTTQVRVVELETTESNILPVQAIVVVERVNGLKGATRHFTQVVSINDAELSRRISAEVHEGDEIIATILDDWGEQGYGTYLTDFKKISPENSEDVVQVLLTPLVAESKLLEYVTNRLKARGFEHQHDYLWRTTEGAIKAEINVDESQSVSGVILRLDARHIAEKTPPLEEVACDLAHGDKMMVALDGGEPLKCDLNRTCHTCDVIRDKVADAVKFSLVGKTHREKLRQLELI